MRWFCDAEIMAAGILMFAQAGGASPAPTKRRR